MDLLDLRLPPAVRAAVGAVRRTFETAKVERSSGERRGRSRSTRIAATSPPRSSSTPWAGSGCSPATSTSRPTRRSRAGSRSIPTAPATSSRSGSTAATSRPATAGASRPATRCGSASARSTPASTSRSRPCASPSDLDREAVRYQGNWIPHKLRPATADGVFFVGDSAGHCLPLTAEGIRTAFYFGIACGRELRRVVEGRADARAALRRYGDFSAGTSGSSSGCCGPRSWCRGSRRGCSPSPCAGWSAELRRLVVRPLPADRATRRSPGAGAPAPRPGIPVAACIAR